MSRFIVEFNGDSDWTAVPKDENGHHSFATEQEAIAFAVDFFGKRRDFDLDQGLTLSLGAYDPTRDGIGVWVHEATDGENFDAPVGFVNPYTSAFHYAASDASPLSLDPRVAALESAYGLARQWQDGEAITAYVILSSAVDAFLAGESADAIRSAATAQPHVDFGS